MEIEFDAGSALRAPLPYSQSKGLLPCEWAHDRLLAGEIASALLLTPRVRLLNLRHLTPLDYRILTMTAGVSVLEGRATIINRRTRRPLEAIFAEHYGFFRNPYHTVWGDKFYTPDGIMFFRTINEEVDAIGDVFRFMAERRLKDSGGGLLPTR